MRLVQILMERARPGPLSGKAAVVALEVDVGLREDGQLETRRRDAHFREARKSEMENWWLG